MAALSGETSVAHLADGMVAWMAALKAGPLAASRVVRSARLMVAYWGKKWAVHWVAQLASRRAERSAAPKATPKVASWAASKVTHLAELMGH